jgi:NADH-quinone oxidoreductase subunit C
MAQQVLDALKARSADALDAVVSIYGDEVVYVKRDKLFALAQLLRDDPAFAFDAPVFCTCTDLLDWNHADSPAGPPVERTADGDPVYRFEISWQLRSTRLRHRLRLKVRATEADPKVPSLTPLWKGFDWQERETFDLYGIVFDGHPDLRRIYLYDEFVGYPLRKDYPKEKRQPLVRRDDLPVVGPRKGELR